jgi:hypothetical protein
MVTGGLFEVAGADHYRIDGVEEMEPFLMTVVSDSDLWMFVSSTGALTAGRVDADHAIFPYETDDRIHCAAGLAGPVTLIARTVSEVRSLWQPFASRPTGGARRSIAKSVLGDRLIFEEHHSGWSLTFRATWVPSDVYGWVRTVELIDTGGASTATYEVLDGLLDVMPAGVDAHTEQIRSNLVDAYKRSETGPWATVAVYSLEALITDRAEPAEALTANVVWSIGFDGADVDLDAHAVDDMLAGRPRSVTHLLTGRPGAYLLRGAVSVPASGCASWTIVSDAGLGPADVVRVANGLAADDVGERVARDVELGSNRLAALLEAADGFQTTADPIADAHHLSNVLFNSMRGGVFPHGHRVRVDDLERFIESRNGVVADAHRGWFEHLDDWCEVADLRDEALAVGDPDLARLVLEYLPLTFSRRHGDPSRPWNRFAIRVRDEDGAKLLAYEGNWRDIFQNWEALLHSYPAFFPNVVAKFMNASTIDGHNPYRISQRGIDWEVPDPDDPWSHIGYWGDHQIIYLLRLLEAWQRYEPGALGRWLERPVFVYANVPYAIASHDAMVADPRNTISYDEDGAELIAAREDVLGSDGRLVFDDAGAMVHVGMLEKLLVSALAKLSSFVPGGGIWINTQRPEWNDANNALAGPGLSMVTLYHLRRYLAFVASLLDRADTDRVELSESVAAWLADVTTVLQDASPESAATDERYRRTVVDALGRSGEAHRVRICSGSGFDVHEVAVSEVRRFCTAASEHLDRAIRSGHRSDGLYHSYNRVSFPDQDTARVDHLGPMLEGQVAVLSSGALDGAGAADLVDALLASEMYRADQDSFMLYPATVLPSFLDRNVLPDDAADVVRTLIGIDDALGELFEADAVGRLHFRSELVNAAALDEHLQRLHVAQQQVGTIHDVYELVFSHSSFTGRSGSMYGYEGIGSIYWHMVSKLLLAVQEAYWTALDAAEPDDVVGRLATAYRRIRGGLGFMKDPVTFGAFPTDCYSHTPMHGGAQQPGMTGQVKEEIVTRLGELGYRVLGGRVSMAPGLLHPDDLFRPDADGSFEAATFSVCAVEMSLVPGPSDSVTIVRTDGTSEHHAHAELDEALSSELFARTGSIARIDWTVAG